MSTEACEKGYMMGRPRDCFASKKAIMPDKKEPAVCPYTNDDVERAASFLREQYAAFWQTLVDREVHYDEENRDMWFAVERKLRPAGFDYENVAMINFVFEIRKFIRNTVLPGIQQKL
jgi:hypothetical protein